jgi:hypothetical protein
VLKLRTLWRQATGEQRLEATLPNRIETLKFLIDLLPSNWIEISYNLPACRRVLVEAGHYRLNELFLVML